MDISCWSDPEKKIKAVKKNYGDKKKFIKWYKKEKIVGNSNIKCYISEFKLSRESWVKNVDTAKT